MERKIQISQTRIIEWYNYYHGNVVVNFSGGKDSTVLLHLVRTIFPDVKAVFSNTGLEYPEIQKHVMSIDNVDIIRPTMRFDEVISTYGYPLISKEVAESIYYARRIRSQDVNREIEGESKTELEGMCETMSIESLKHSSGRSPSSGKWKNYHRRCLNPDKNNPEDKDRFFNKPSTISWADWQMGLLNKTEDQFEKKSQYNKEKWLPMVYTPFMISHYCCQKMKKSPMKKYQHKCHLYPLLGTLSEESRIRKQAWIRHGCNAFESSNPTSQPLSFWTEQDILAYIVRYDLTIASVYGNIVSVHDGSEYPAKDMCGNIGGNLKCTGCDRTGCVFCGFGFHLEKKSKTKFQRLAETHPKQYEYSIGGGQWVDNPYYDATASEYDGRWKNWNPKKIWVPSKKGLGMGKVFDMANEIYGKDFYRYK